MERHRSDFTQLKRAEGTRAPNFMVLKLKKSMKDQTKALGASVAREPIESAGQERIPHSRSGGGSSKWEIKSLTHSAVILASRRSLKEAPC